MSAQPQRTKAVDLLHRAQILPRPECERILALLQGTTDRAEDVIIDSEILSEADLLKALSGIYRTQFVSTERLSKADIPRATVQMIPRKVAEMFGVFPVVFDRQSSVLSVVTPDPDNADMLREVKLVSGAKDVRAFVARPAAILAAIQKHHAGNPRAFERFDRERIGMDFGQQVLADGRVLAPKETQARTLGTYDRASPPPLLPPTPAQAWQPQPAPPPPVPQRRSSPQLDPRMGELDDPMDDLGLDEPARPPPPPAARGSVKRITADRPVGPAQAHRAQDIPAAREPSMLMTPGMERSAGPASERGNALQNDTTIELLTVMVSLLENTRQELRGHSSQVARLIRQVAERMHLEATDMYAAVFAGHIHDLGKMGQFHLTALNSSEYEGHRNAALKACETPLKLLETVHLPPAIKNATYHMYERFDGKGFPDKLSGKEIPLGARLLSIADTYADLTQNPRNPFRKVLSAAEAMDVLMKHRGTIFDPSMLDLFKSVVLDEDMRAKLLANRRRALVIEPDPEESTVLELRMIEQGFDVKIARTAEAARKLFTTEGLEFDLVVCEVELPDADGLSLLSEARGEPWGRELAWIVHTHKQGRTEAQRAFENGAMDFVAKPVQADVLVAKIKAMIEQRAKSGKGGAAKGVSGSLREMGLPDIVQVLFHGRKTGKLAVKSGHQSGEIHFLEGAVANAMLGELAGANAFYAMVRFTDGEFALDPSFTPPKRVVTESAEALLLEGMRRMDEGL